MTSFKLILSYFNKFHEETYKKKLKIDHLNDKTIFMINYVKKYIIKVKKNQKKLCKK